MLLNVKAHSKIRSTVSFSSHSASWQTSDFRRSFNYVELCTSLNLRASYTNLSTIFSTTRTLSSISFCKTEPISSCLHVSLRLKVSLFLDITTAFFLCLEDILITDSFTPGNLFARLPNEFKRNKGKLFACQLILKRICCCTERNFAQFEASTDSQLDVFRDCNCFETIDW